MNTATSTPILALALALSLPTAFHGAQAMPTVEEEIKALPGLEFTLYMVDVPIAPDRLSCIYEGGGMVAINDKYNPDWMKGYLNCRGRTVVILTRVMAKEERWTTQRVIDAMLLPPLSPDRRVSPPGGLVMYDSIDGPCELLRQPPRSFLALVHWGKRTLIDWRTGVRKAWTYDLDKGRIIPLPARDIVCEYNPP